MRATRSMRVASSAIRLTLRSSGPAECNATSACMHHSIPSNMTVPVLDTPFDCEATHYSDSPLVLITQLNLTLTQQTCDSADLTVLAEVLHQTSTILAVSDTFVYTQA